MRMSGVVWGASSCIAALAAAGALVTCLYPPSGKVTATIRTPEQIARRRAAEERSMAELNASLADYRSNNPVRVQAALHHVRQLNELDRHRSYWASVLATTGRSQEAYDCFHTYVRASRERGIIFDEGTIKSYRGLAEKHGSLDEIKWLDENYGPDYVYKNWLEGKRRFLSDMAEKPRDKYYSLFVKRICESGRKSFPEHLDEINRMENEFLALKRPSP